MVRQDRKGTQERFLLPAITMHEEVVDKLNMLVRWQPFQRKQEERSSPEFMKGTLLKSQEPGSVLTVNFLLRELQPVTTECTRCLL